VPIPSGCLRGRAHPPTPLNDAAAILAVVVMALTIVIICAATSHGRCGGNEGIKAIASEKILAGGLGVSFHSNQRSCSELHSH